MGDKLYNRLITAAQVEPPRPPGFKADLPPDDAPLTGDIQGLVEQLAGVAMAMDYVDSKGAESRRRVVVRSVTQSSGGLILLKCFCCERKAPRAFRVDRIQSLWSITTGEVRTDILEALTSFAVITPAVNELQALRPFAPELSLLVHLARADGDFELEERGAIVDFIGEAVEGIDPGSSKIADHLARLYPNSDMMAGAIAESARWPEARRLRLDRHVRTVCDADGELEDEEFAAIGAIRDALSAIKLRN